MAEPTKVPGEDEDFMAIAEHYMPQANCFIAIAKGKGIDLKNREEWWPWWAFFVAGMNSVDDPEEFDEWHEEEQ